MDINIPFPEEGTLYVFSTLPGGYHMAYALNAATVNVDYPDSASLSLDAFRYTNPLPPRMTIEGIMKEGKLWRPNDVFTPDPTLSLEAPRGELRE